jgi:ABC-type sugar transport system substrate-binding protein
MPSRLVIAVIAAVLLAGAVVAAAAQETTSVTIGILGGYSREWKQASRAAFRRELQELGWGEGTNLVIEERFADGDVARLPALMSSSLRRRPAHGPRCGRRRRSRSSWSMWAIR